MLYQVHNDMCVLYLYSRRCCITFYTQEKRVSLPPLGIECICLLWLLKKGKVYVYLNKDSTSSLKHIITNTHYYANINMTSSYNIIKCLVSEDISIRNTGCGKKERHYKYIYIKRQIINIFFFEN